MLALLVIGHYYAAGLSRARSPDRKAGRRQLSPETVCITYHDIAKETDIVMPNMLLYESRD